jgi:hypothetical protein
MARREYFTNGVMRNFSDEITMHAVYSALGTKNIECVLLWNDHYLFFSRDAARDGLEVNKHVEDWLDRSVDEINPWVVCGTVVVAPVEDFAEAIKKAPAHA